MPKIRSCADVWSMVDEYAKEAMARSWGQAYLNTRQGSRREGRVLDALCTNLMQLSSFDLADGTTAPPHTEEDLKVMVLLLKEEARCLIRLYEPREWRTPIE